MHTAARLLMRPAAPAFLVALLVATAWQLGANADVPKFGETLPLAIKFFEAQMSGEVPAWSYATQTHEWAEHGAWRSNSHLQDGQPSYELKGGWYADGGHIKNTQTIAASASVLAFAGLTWETTFKGEGLYLELLRNVDWAAQYIEKCSVTGNKFVAQVGDHFTEEAYWGGPERAPYSLVKYSSGWRPVYTIDLEAKCDGADVLSEAVAALAGAGLLHLKASSPDTARGNALIEKAKQLWAITKDINAVWKVPEGNRTIYSRTYADDKTWAAAWLCKVEIEADGAAGAACEEAVSYYGQMTLREGVVDYDDMHGIAIAFLLNLGVGDAAALVKDLKERWLDNWTKRVSEATAKDGPTNKCVTCKPLTGPCGLPGGFVLGTGRSSTAYSTGMAFLALSAVSGPAGEAAFGSTTAKSLRCAATTQIKYLLGANPGKQAFVTGLDIIDGFDTSIAVPQNPRHRAASCKGEVCYGLGENNPHKLLGALVGGPKADGSYTDSRIAEPDNLVSLEFNGPFTGAVAGLTAIEDTLSCSA